MIIWSTLLYVVARLEVTFALARHSVYLLSNASEHTLKPCSVPSIASGEGRDRVLAEIDQNGLTFAIDPRDAGLFTASSKKSPRKHHRIEIILRNGKIRLRKQRLKRGRSDLRSRIFAALDWDFYLESAALLRLRGVRGVPVVRHIDKAAKAIEMDYIWGRDLRPRIDGENLQLPEWDGDIPAHSEGKCLPAVSRQIGQIISAVVNRGVIPRDLHSGNFIKAYGSDVVYMVDFDLVYLKHVPGWRQHMTDLNSWAQVYLSQ